MDFCPAWAWTCPVGPDLVRVGLGWVREVSEGGTVLWQVVKEGLADLDPGLGEVLRGGARRFVPYF